MKIAFCQCVLDVKLAAITGQGSLLSQKNNAPYSTTHSLSSTLVFLIAVFSVENLYWDAELRSELGMVAPQRYQLSYAAPT
jgi:hypothetical protein